MWGELAARPCTLTLLHVAPTVTLTNSRWVHLLTFTTINVKMSSTVRHTYVDTLTDVGNLLNADAES